MRYHAKFTNYTVPAELPVYIEFVGKGRHPENHIHDHNFTEIVLILSGEGLYELENVRCKIKAGDLLIVPPGLAHPSFEPQFEDRAENTCSLTSRISQLNACLACTPFLCSFSC